MRQDRKRRIEVARLLSLSKVARLHRYLNTPLFVYLSTREGEATSPRHPLGGRARTQPSSSSMLLLCRHPRLIFALRRKPLLRERGERLTPAPNRALGLARLRGSETQTPNSWPTMNGPCSIMQRLTVIMALRIHEGPPGTRAVCTTSAPCHPEVIMRNRDLDLGTVCPTFCNANRLVFLLTL